MAMRVLLCCFLAGTVSALRRGSRRVDSADQPAPAPAPQGAFIQYYRAPNHSDIAANMPTCDYWRPEDLGKKVPDECCSVSAWPASVGFSTDGPDARTIINDDSGKTVRCYARERVPAPGTYVRNFFGCYQGELMAAEGCAPTGTSMGHGYPLPSTEAAIESSVDGDPVSCNCEKPWYNQGPGCYVAASGYITGVSPDPTANFLKVSGDCPSGSALSQSEEEQPFPSLVDQALPKPLSRRRKTDADLPITADPGTMRGYTGPAENPGMVYMVMMDINEIPKYQPQCASTFEDDTIGTKLPDECCEPEKWRGEDGNMPSSWFWSGPDIMSKPGEEENWTCYPRVSPGPFTGPPDGIGPAMQWIRNYIGCEDGKLQAHENCVPDAVQYVSQAQYEAGSGWSYPMNETYALTQFEDITGDECHCSVQSHFNEGAGCYIAYAKLAQFTGAYPGVFVRVEGTCNAPPNTRRRRRRSTGRRRNLMDILP